MNRSAPATGYNFEAKIAYRKRMWTLFRRLQGRRADTSNVLFMPSIEGDEIGIAKSYGFQMFRMHIVDRNPAIVAHLKRRWPAVNTYGVDIVPAVKRAICATGRLDVLHLDFCSNMNDNLHATLRAVAHCLPTNSVPIVAVNVLRGRETKDRQNTLRSVAAVTKEEDARLAGVNMVPLVNFPVSPDMSDLDRGRLGAVMCALTGTQFAQESAADEAGFWPILQAYGSYGSTAGTQTMLWSVWMLLGRESIPFLSRGPRLNKLAGVRAEMLIEQ